jgi:NAD(P)H-nitrite reductase large subunit
MIKSLISSLLKDGIGGLLKGLSELFYNLTHKEEILLAQKKEAAWDIQEKSYQARISSLTNDYNKLSQEKAQVQAALTARQVEYSSLAKQLEEEKKDERTKINAIDKQSDIDALRSLQ